MDIKKWFEKFKSIIILLPIIVFSAIVPLIVFTKYVPLNDFISSHWFGEPVSADVFSYYKMLVIIGCAVVALIIMIYKLINKTVRVKISFVFFITLAYGFLILLSAVFSKFAVVAFWGAPERYEGAIVLLSYLILFIYTITFADDMKSIKIIMSSIIISSVLITTISVLQFFGFDIFKNHFFKSILNMLPNNKNPYEVNTIFADFQSYSTMYNPNFLGLYISLILPISFAFFASRKSNSGRLTASLLVYLCVLSLIGSSAAGGYYAVVVSIVLLLFFSFSYIKRNVINVVMLSVIVIGLLLLTNMFTGGRIAGNINILGISNEVERIETGGKSIYIKNITLGDNHVFIDTTDKDFSVINENKSISVLDVDKNEIPVFVYDEGENDTFPGNLIPFRDSEYSNYIITTNDDYSIFAVKAGIRVMYFHMTDEGVRVPGLNNELDILHPVSRNKFLYERPYLFSGRGYIWAGILPLLKDTLILGNGPDTVFLTYPQYDYIGKINMTGKFNVIIEKPHCYYLQLAHDTGLISLILLLSLFAYYFLETIIVLIKNKRRGIWRIYTIGIFCGVSGYLIASLMYDSTVFVSPVFWTIFAIGISLNRLIKTAGKSSKQKSGQI